MERAERFYNNEIYDSKYIAQFNLFQHTTEQFNPVPKCVNMVKDLALKKEIGIEAGDEEDRKDRIEDFWANNNLQDKKYEMTEDLLTKRKIYVELVKKEGEINLVLHEPSNVEHKEGKYCKIEGEKEVFNLDSKEFETIQVTKEYYNIDGYRKLIETRSDEGDKSERVWGFPFLPVVEFTTEYDLKQLFNKTDRVNEIKAMLKKLFWLHGDPISYQSANDSDTPNAEIGEATKDSVKGNKFQHLRLLNIGANELEYLEMNGNMVDRMQNEIEQIQDEIKNDYPEYELANILSQGNPSGEALKTVAVEIIARVKSFRSDFAEGLKKVNNLALEMMGEARLDHSITFQGILPDNLADKVEIITELRGMKLIDKETAIEILQEFYPNKPKEVINKLIEEDNLARQGIIEDLSGSDADS